MTFTLTIDMDNEAFNDDMLPGAELARILETAARRVEDALTSELLDADRASTTLRDINGNTVGSWQVTTR